MSRVLPIPHVPGAQRPVVIAVGEHAAEVPRRVAERISDIRFPGDDGIEGFRIESQDWRDLRAYGARRLQPPEMEDLS